MTEFSLRVTGKINKVKLREDILNSITRSPEFIGELRKIFQRANRRIQNIRRKDYFSPALLALGEINDGYTVFSTSLSDWEELKREYAKAVAFLNAPTSTATGAREYEQSIKSQFNLDDDTFAAMKRELGNRITSVAGLDFVERQFWGDSKGVAREFKEAAKSLSGQLEADSIRAANSLQRTVSNAADAVANAIESVYNSLEGLEKSINERMRGVNI